MITIALPKGRLAQQTVELLKRASLVDIDISEESRKLIIEDTQNSLRFLMVKPFDVPTYVEYGVADVGVVGKDVLLEMNKRVYELLDLKIGKCFVALAGPKGISEALLKKPDKTIATKFPNIAKEYFENVRGEDVKIIKLNGSVELAPILGLSDMIVDIVESGRTLKENGLEVYEKLYDISARLIANRASLKLKTQIDDIINRLERMIEE
ncbi:ATP phosphoribosyltransferase [Caldicellulosiruptor bescii]|uniref:ATP phosphoribosyltransferase n=3 Tax=Caldicellulosiruptor TaxID=44000 RepID=HIS1_CALBD|nr:MULTISPECIES: ATP phosphoribosyltransferase [Caldicellulosiruptor]B9MJR9.1 RecName: Full=ATP phosphoribosyltransferase; Short=ATP-PRT; Short=ATP-PRTase [Caldicellulosiruptor bescii DSM 6725]ACM60577.1 ATP phosphoribosyltransferase [Caldicellulosiruptor bescii DSM 6725]ADQ46092.1 ATP phosphoribosyltransferase [Caldicellulosiruptor kronotskyensis 2002]PBC87988.1 ATP phosphoribosyltransferase [Caldicellulosiruptor bescii]PBC90920.1 ATP phosphoribosyltransferase [Caldicellulosiruptor bescii]PB